MANSTTSKPSAIEWIQAIGTIVAAIGLIYTLILQREVTESQLDLAQRDYLRYEQDIAPELKVDLHWEKETSGYATFHFKHNPAYEVQIRNTSDSGYIINGLTSDPEDFNVNDSTAIYFELDMTKASSEKLEEIMLGFEFKFKDKIGNSYMQDVYTASIYDKFNNKIPTLVKRVDRIAD